MTILQPFPTLADHLPELAEYVYLLSRDVARRRVSGWQGLEHNVKTFFTPQRMDVVERTIPGWIEMSSYADGVTLVHVLGVLALLRRFPEYQQASAEMQALADWTALLHDLAKQARPEQRDAMHGFRSAALAAMLLPNLGFPATPMYPALVSDWYKFTWDAAIYRSAQEEPDNERLPQILNGIAQMMGETSPTGMLLQTILLHVSLPLIEDYPPAAPVAQDFIRRHLNREVYPLFRLLALADNDSWCVAEPERREPYRTQIMAYFAQL